MGCVANTGKYLATALATVTTDALTLPTAGYTAIIKTNLGDMFTEKGGNGELLGMRFTQTLSTTAGTLASMNLRVMFFENDDAITSTSAALFTLGVTGATIMDNIEVEAADWVELDPLTWQASKSLSIPVWTEGTSTTLSFAAKNLNTFSLVSNAFVIMPIVAQNGT